MTYKAPGLICISAALLLGSACYRGGTAASNAGHDNVRVGEHSPTPTATAGAQKNLTQKEVAQLAIDSGDKERKGLYSNDEYGYAVTIPEGIIGVSAPSPYPQHGFSIPLSKQPETQIRVAGSFNAAMHTSLSEAAEADLKFLRDESEEVEVRTRESVKLHNLDAMRVIAKYKDKAAGATMIQDFVIAIRWNAEPDGPEAVYTLRLRTPESRYGTDKVILEKLISTWKLTPLGK